MKLLVELTKHENNELRLNGVWGLMVAKFLLKSVCWKEILLMFLFTVAEHGVPVRREHKEQNPGETRHTTDISVSCEIKNLLV